MWSNFFRKLRLKAGKLILDAHKGRRDFAIDKIKKVLFVRYDGKIGDYIVSSFVYREIKKQRPDIQIHVVCVDSNLDMFKDNPFIDQYFVLKNRSYSSFYKLGKQLSKENYDLLIDPTHTLRNRDLFFIRLVNAAINFGFDKDNYHQFNKSIPKRESRITDAYAAMISEIGFAIQDRSYELTVDEHIKDKINTFLSPFSHQKIVALNLFGASRSRNITTENSIKIIECIHRNLPDYQIVLLVYPKVVDFVKELIAAIPSVPLAAYFDTSSIFYSIQIVAQSEIVVTPDTAIVHIADGLNKKLLTFYSGEEDNYVRWKPRNKASIIRYNKNINEVTIEQFEEGLKQIIAD